MKIRLHFTQESTKKGYSKQKDFRTKKAAVEFFKKHKNRMVTAWLMHFDGWHSYFVCDLKGKQ